MKMLLLRLLAVFTSLTAVIHAQDPTFVPASGLQITLGTSGYKFFVGDTAAAVPSLRGLRSQATKLGGVLPTNDGFAASVVLANSSRSEIPFQFNDAGAAEVKFHFSVSDAAGALVWESDAGLISAQVITPLTLGKGQRWKRLVQIPLKVSGAWLKPGRYTLETTLLADPAVAASTIFEVASATEVTGADTGISGHVLQAAPASPLAKIAPQPIKATINIREIRLPNARYDHPAFSYLGTTDDLGAFKVVTPPGRFEVTATPLSAQPTPVAGTVKPAITSSPQLSKTVEVSVEKGAFSDVTITLDAGTGETGVTGLVLIGPITPVSSIGQRNEAPLANATVTITEIQIPGVYYIRGPWTFSTTTDREGRFKQLTPSGRYRVSATPGAVTVSPLAASASSTTTAIFPTKGAVEVTVNQGTLSDVTLHLDSGIRLPVAL